MKDLPGHVEIREITTGETAPLRLAVLRPGRSIEASHFSGDDAQTTRHFGAFRDGQLLSIASLLLAEMPEQPGISAYQLRGMATAADARGSGLGRALVRECIAFARKNGAPLVWCNARTEAAEFYRKLDFQTAGEEFELPGVGPHYRMFVRLD